MDVMNFGKSWFCLILTVEERKKGFEEKTTWLERSICRGVLSNGPFHNVISTQPLNKWLISIASYLNIIDQLHDCIFRMWENLCWTKLATCTQQFAKSNNFLMSILACSLTLCSEPRISKTKLSGVINLFVIYKNLSFLKSPDVNVCNSYIKRCLEIIFVP